MPNYLGAGLFLAIGSICISIVPVMAGQAPTQSTRQYSPLESIEYDPIRSGPLLLVLGGKISGRAIPHDRSLSPDQWADAFGRKVVTVGSLTVLAPGTMQVIEDRPGVPDPYAKLKPEERLKVLLSLFTEDQWKQAGSDAGIGLEDLNESQRPLFAGLLPETISVQHSKLAPGDTPNSVRYESLGGPEQEDPAAAHLRLNRKVSFGFSKAGSDDYGYRGGDDMAVGNEITTLVQGRQARGDAHEEPGIVKAFGVPIIQTVPNELKRGQLDFTAPRLRAQIPLDADTKTLGDLLGRVAQITGLELVADRRVTTLPLLWRLAPGQKARARDILEALCWSVTGAFRRVGDSTFLLSDDIQGIGARFARLSEWAEPPFIARQKALNELNQKTAKNNPLSHIGFVPGDNNVLPKALLQSVDDSYLNGGEAPEVSPTNLSASLQQMVEKQIQFWADNNANLRTDRVQVFTKMIAQFVFPNGTAVEAPFSENIGMQYLQFASARSKSAVPAAAAPHPVPKPMPASLHKRVLVVQMPMDDKPILDLLTLAKHKGFTEVWLHVMLNDGEAAERLRTALKAARKVGISIGCAVSLLRNGGLRAPEDINVFGETGEHFSKRRIAEHPDNADQFKVYAGWSVLDPGEVARILTPIAEVQGLSALALKATAAPGWAGDIPGGDGIVGNGHLGYTTETRLSCIRTAGFDPIDASPYLYMMDVDSSLPFFPAVYVEEVWKMLADFRFRENTQMLSQIHAAVREVAPTLPLYLDDRASQYAYPYLAWYGRWDSANRIPKNDVYAVESQGRAAAFASTEEPIRIRYGRNGNPESLASSFGSTAQDAAKNWRGAALDLAVLSPADALHMLSALPTSP